MKTPDESTLNEFNRRYWGDPSQTEFICEGIAKDEGMDPEAVKEYVYLNRYAQQDKLADELDELVESEEEDDTED